MKYILTTFRPIIQTAAGRKAVKRFCLPEFIDGSCRREPDFENEFPSITGTCRPGKLAMRLKEGDFVLYMTTKSKYMNDISSGWRFVSLLRVVTTFSNHVDAARWYQERGAVIPSNCFVDGNFPKSFDQTHQKISPEAKRRLCFPEDNERAVCLWNRVYKNRIKKYPKFVACQPIYLELSNPPQIKEKDMYEIFGKLPGTQNPPSITKKEAESLLQIAGIDPSLISRAKVNNPRH